MRPATHADAEAVLAVVVARDVADLGAPDFTLGALRDEWRRDGFDPAEDAVVIEDGGRVVAVAWMRERNALAAVHPEAEGRGHGGALLAWAEARATALGRTVHRQDVADAAGRRLLEAAGYRYITSFRRMGIEFAVRAPVPPRWPDGVRPRALDAEADAPALWELVEAGFAAVPSWQAGTLAGFRAEHLGASDLDRELTVVAEAGDRPVGVALVHRDEGEPEAFVGLLAVDPAAKGRGVGSALLAHALTRGRDAGLARGVLWVDAANPRALALYERAGMAQTGEAARYERPVS